MNKNNSHIIYTAKDIHNYFSGKLSNAEMHAMEKAALSDPLLAEAMEGYENMASIKQPADFAQLQKELDELKNKLGKAKPGENKFNWKVAASVLLLIGVAFAFYFILRSTHKEEVVINNAVPVPATNINPDSSVKIDGTITNTSSIKNDSSVFKKELSKNTATGNALAVNEQSKKEIKSIAAEDNNNVIQPKDKTDIASLKETKKSSDAITTTFSGKVVDVSNTPVPFATLLINNHQQAKTDANGIFSLSLPDATVRLDISAKDYFPKTVTANAGDFVTVTLSSQKNNLKKDNNLADTLTRSRVLVLYKRGAEPKMGWDEYNLYMVNMLSNSLYDDGRRVAGETIFTFEINRSGQPVNFNFEKSIDEDVNEGLETFILNGPEWRFISNEGTPGLIRMRIVF
ncbi:carboxypeptidase-like regulatory domain-containing protein [Ferruginibacter albus]|uniref:carboxypeptidase-like regulatory domain-containing protein n=1 Tax=Ferruginibacter albus TaxID=2875540 RepID=UPI001CC3D946|nr:carboxypeptidase-like regulatory domain-containing protein [Ferruginibacter albus]UAY52698.1 carboxypeptidase-like regulatory domain-containing protein [Ferruginibacter albus]